MNSRCEISFDRISQITYIASSVEELVYIMNKILILLFIAMIYLSGCVGSEKMVKKGDNITVDYTGSLLNGVVFDTSIKSVAEENNLTPRRADYKPLKIQVGMGQVIEGFDEGVIGMKVGETRKLTIPPEKAYGPKNPEMIQTIPIIQEIPATRVIPKVFEVPLSQFERTVGPNHTAGEIVTIPDTNINLTVVNISTLNVNLSYRLKVGDSLWSKGAPWNETVEKIDNNNITLRTNLKKNDVIQLQGAPWNTTVVGLDNVNITLRHNPIEETFIPGMFGQMKVSFNETSIILDQNPKLAGETLVFNVTLLSID